MAKKATAGERVLMRCYGAVTLDELRTEIPWIREAKFIDSEIRRAVKEAWNYGEYAGRCDGHKRADMQDHIEKRYGVKL